MNRPLSLILLIVVIMAAVAAAVTWWVLSGAPPDDGNQQARETEEPFPTEAFFTVFDLDQSGKITPDEFTLAYAKWEQKRRYFTSGSGGALMTAAEAFRELDVNKDGVLDRKDLQVAYDSAWLKFKLNCAAKGLEARLWKGKWLKLNPQQVEVLNKEIGAANRDELPFGGAFFDKKYFEGRRFVEISTASGESARGFLREDRANARLQLLTGDAMLRVFRPDEVKVQDLPDAPQLEYIERVANTSYEDPAACLELARRCKELGLLREAGMMYARVLVFERENEEAQRELGFRLEGDKFVKRQD